MNRQLVTEQMPAFGSLDRIDVTNDVVAALNAALPTVQTTAPAQATRAQNQPQGR